MDNQSNTLDAWKRALEQVIESMKYREAKHRREADDALIKAEAVQTERMELETVLYKAKLIE